MRKLISIGLILVLAWQCFHRLGVLSFFYLNRDYIARELCINKDNPSSDCKGKCHLKKQLELGNEAGDRESNRKEVASSFPEFIPGSFLYHFGFSHSRQKHTDQYSLSLPCPTGNLVYHPPRFS